MVAGGLRGARLVPRSSLDSSIGRGSRFHSQLATSQDTVVIDSSISLLQANVGDPAYGVPKAGDLPNDVGWPSH